MKLYRSVVCAFLCVVLTHAATATADETLFLNPFMTADEMRLERDALPDATLRLHYRETRSERAGPEEVFDVSIEVAEDWALVEDARGTFLFDFQLLRAFTIDPEGKTFVAFNLTGNVTFRVMERQNRVLMQEIATLAGSTEISDDACDAETELGVAFGEAVGDVEIVRTAASTTAMCNGRLIGTLVPGEGRVAPAALVPTLANVFAMHPALAAELGTDRPAPQGIKSSFNILGEATMRSWELVSSETVSLAYPLTNEFENASSLWLGGKTGVATATLAADAVGGRAGDGPPDRAAWDVALWKLARTGTGAAAALAVLPTFSMFPELLGTCREPNTWAACALLANLQAIARTDTAVAAAMAIVSAEQAGNQAAVIEAMLAAQTSALKDDPVLGQTFAIALMHFGPQFQAEAAKIGLPSDPLPLMLAAVEAYPYSPAYWTDLGDLFATNWDYQASMMLYEVALALPMPEAQRAYPVLQGKVSFAARIRADFPTFYLPE